MKRIAAIFLACMLLLAACAAAEPYESEYGVRFGMTPQEIQRIETGYGNELTGSYEGVDSFQLYYETDIHFRSLRCLRMEYDFDPDDRLLFQIQYVTRDGFADYTYAKIKITEQYGAPVSDEGSSYLYTFIGDGNHIECAHWSCPDQNLGIDLWYNEYDTVFILFYDITNPVSFAGIQNADDDPANGGNAEESGDIPEYPADELEGTWILIEASTEYMSSEEIAANMEEMGGRVTLVFMDGMMTSYMEEHGELVQTGEVFYDYIDGKIYSDDGAVVDAVVEGDILTITGYGNVMVFQRVN